ncbi:hypothetical protein HOLleu_03394 [Holothuria leucospilota]|uniref:Uncharacterized protein n=1 Tax=Holothuria leucospilota TaxID=206669 RepID=A0A9Q1CSH8_HOLLE|nr:hypothetical protein HOLleu_03394 [Holothuria leucospilota]
MPVRRRKMCLFVIRYVNAYTRLSFNWYCFEQDYWKTKLSDKLRNERKHLGGIHTNPKKLKVAESTEGGVQKMQGVSRCIRTNLPPVTPKTKPHKDHTPKSTTHPKTTPRPTATPSPKATPRPKASPRPTATLSPKATPRPKATPSPKATPRPKV